MARQIRTSAKAVIIQNDKLPLFPSKLHRPIMNFYEGKEYIKYLGNEEIGDTECLE